jgi:chromate reductase, NAD(P)H dehydrogenase (quinone)
MAKPIKTAAFCGSLRKASFNRMLLKQAIKLAPGDMTIEEIEIGNLGLYNNDLHQAGFPAAAQQAIDRVAASDAVLFVTPEYNYSIPAPLKNAIDWISRAPNQPFAGKPAAVMGASMGLMGSVRAQMHLRHSMVFLNMLPVNRPEVMVGQAQNKFDAAGNLTDEAAKGLIRDLLAALAAWTRKLRGD